MCSCRPTPSHLRATPRSHRRHVGPSPPTRTLKRVALLSLMAAIAAVALSGDVQGARPDPMTEVVVTLRAHPLSAFGRGLLSASHRDYLARIDAEQSLVAQRVQTTLPAARVRWHYRHRRERARRRPSPLPGREAVRHPGRRRGLAEHPLPRAARHGRPGADRRRQALGPELRDCGQRHEDRDHRRRSRRDASVLRPERLPVPARLPEGADEVHDAEGDRAAGVHAGHRRRRSTRSCRSTR